MLIHQTPTLAPDGKPINLYCLRNSQGMEVQVMDWGATWLSCKVPVHGSLREVLLGCQLQDYPIQQVYMGVTVGRYANRIAQSEFSLNGKEFRLVANQGKHQLHGGVGFDKVRWRTDKCGENFVQFSHFSPDGDQGFGGNVQVSVQYRLTEQNGLVIEYTAISDQDTPLNLTNHAYFNLEDAENGSDIRSHFLQLNSDYFLPVDQEGIPNAPLKSVVNTSFDFRQSKGIQQDFLQEEQQVTKGYDHAFLLNSSTDKPCAILTALDGSLSMQVFTTQPTIQVYTGNYLNGTPNRQNGTYCDYAGVALETQALPDTPNHPEWQQYGGISLAHERYNHRTEYRFVV